MQGESQQDLNIEVLLARNDVLEGESIDLKIVYSNAGDVPQWFLVPDPRIPPTFELEIALRDQGGILLARVNHASLPESFPSIHAEPVERTILPGAKQEFLIDLSSYLPRLSVGCYTPEAFHLQSADADPSSFPLCVQPHGPVHTAHSEREGALIGLTTAYVVGSKRNQVVVERLEDLAIVESGPDVSDWPVRFRRRVARTDVALAQVLVSRKAHVSTSWRHILLKAKSGRVAFLPLRQGQPARMSAWHDLRGEILPGTLRSDEDDRLSFLATDGDKLTQIYAEEGRIDTEADVETGQMEAYTMYTENDSHVLFFVAEQDHQLLWIDLQTQPLVPKSLHRYSRSVTALKAVTVLDVDYTAVLLIALPEEASIIEGDLPDVFLWSQNNASRAVTPDEYQLFLANFAHVSGENGDWQVTTLEGGRFKVQHVQAESGEVVDAFRIGSGRESRTLVISRADDWLQVSSLTEEN